MRDETLPPRTSISDPLRIDAARHATGLIFGITMRPGRKGMSITGPDWDRDVEADLRAVEDWRPDIILEVMSSRGGSVEDLGTIARLQHFTTSANIIDTDAAEEALTLAVMTGLRGPDRARVLIISENGMEDAASVLIGLLMRLGDDAAEAVRFSERLRPGSFSTEWQKRMIRTISAVDWAGPFRDAALRKRQSEPAHIRRAKSLAKDISVSTGMSRAAALEQVSRNAGHKNWNTFRISGGKASLINFSDDPVSISLRLREMSAETTVCALMFATLGADNRGNGLWRDRARLYAMAAVGAWMDRLEQEGGEASARALRQSFEFEVLTSAVVSYFTGELRGCRSDDLARLALMLPGFSIRLALIGEEQAPKTIEMAEFISMGVTHGLERLIEERTGEGGPLKAGLP